MLSVWGHDLSSFASDSMMLINKITRVMSWSPLKKTLNLHVAVVAIFSRHT